jgi:hypothetical protein
MPSATLSHSQGQPLRLSTKRRGGTSCSASASSLAADAAIRGFNDGRRRSRGEGAAVEHSNLGQGVDAFASNFSATLEALGMPRWILPAVVLVGVGVVLASAVANTLPMLERHAVAGTATFNGRPLANATVAFQRVTDAASSEPRVVRTAADGSFAIGADKGLPSGIYAITVRPGESAVPIPPNYRSPDTSPLRFEIREDLAGMQISTRDGRQPVRKNRR